MFGVSFYVSGNIRKNTSVIVLSPNDKIDTYTKRTNRNYVAVPKAYINSKD